jgi:CRISPR-associated protein Cas6
VTRAVFREKIMPKVDLCFPLLGEHLPADHGYLLYAAVSRLLPAAHPPEPQAFQTGPSQADGFGIHPIRGRQLGGRTLQLTEQSRLAIRTEAEQIPRFLPLAGKQLFILNRPFRVGVPQVRSLVPAVAIRSRLVTIKLADAMAQTAAAAIETFRASALRKLGELGISTEARLSIGKRRTVRIKDREVVGYEVLVEALTAEESICLQEAGLGGRRHMGCGVFAAANGRTNQYERSPNEQ